MTKKLRILIVEDIEMIADFMQLVLIRHGFEVTGVVSSGEDAVNTVVDTSPDLVLMDIKLRGFVDGIEAAQIIRSNSDIPVVFVSAHTEPDIIGKALATGANGYLIKPFKGKDLVSTLERVLGNPHADGPSDGPARNAHPRIIHPA
jgi:DNA-binding response OmpR family regulator